MYTPIRRSAYPDTRDEQAMRRFMAGTLNVGHHLTFQRKGSIVNLFPQPSEKEKLNKIFEIKKIHKNDRCVNARLTLHETPLPVEKQLSRDLEYQRHPYNLAEITLMPAETLSETGKRRNMHMQTHKDLTDIDPVHVFGIGQKKGQLALLQLIKDAYDFKRDLFLDEQEEAARNARPFVTPRDLNATEQLMNLPADPNRHFRDLFESQSQQASTPSEVGYNAHQAAMQYIQGNMQAGTANTRPRINSNNSNIPTRREGDVFESPASVDSQRFQPSTLVSRFHPQVNQNQFESGATSSQFVSPPQPNMNNSASVEEIVDAGMVAVRKIYQSPAVNTNAQQPIPQLPNVEDFLDVERCRTILQQVDAQAYDMFAAWQNNQKYTCQPSWVVRAKSVLQDANEDSTMDDSGIVAVQEPTKETEESSNQVNADNDATEESLPDEGESAIQATSTDRHFLYTNNTPSRFIDHQKDKERNDEYDDTPTPTMSAASTLLSLSPAKVIEAGQPYAH